MEVAYLQLVVCVLLWSPVKTATTERNVDIMKPIVIRSPAASLDLDDGFGWAAILHQTEPLLEDDTMTQALTKTR